MKPTVRSCISVRQVLSCKVKYGENINKARLCARGFKELKDLPRDSPCCSRIGVQSVFALIAFNIRKVQINNVKKAFLQEKQQGST